ncbi:MAG: hypothetical protein Ctma_1553 [Catillopecten margaritatus gill symbiont]|uniref:Uncharacterized protein n=1 Tax=Catillopecten margaritatus gill symbiont TaxID=3083288 RepID=A0AAU6PIH3_9GAMM
MKYLILTLTVIFLASCQTNGQSVTSKGDIKGKIKVLIK